MMKHHFSTLNQREIEILKLLAEGLSQKEIAAKLRLSKTNVNNYMRRSREKSGSLTTVHMVAKAIEQKLIV